MKKSWIYILIAALTFTTLEPVSKLMADTINPISMTFIRFFIGSLVLLPFSLTKLKKSKVKMNLKDFLVMTFLGVLCICVSMVLLQYAIKIADSPALIAIIISINSVFTIILAALILKDKITPVKVVGVVICLIGVIVCADIKTGSNLLSIVLALLAAVTFSLYTVLSKKMMKKFVGVVQTGISFFMGSLVLLIFLLIFKIDILGGLSLKNIIPMGYLGIVVTGVGYWAYFRSMEKVSAMAASMVFFIKPVLTPFATFFINGIVPNVTVFIALILVVIGSFLATNKKENLIHRAK